MTARPPLGVVPQRPPQRTLSGTGLSQRPATQHQRSLSSQFLPSSPIRRGETFTTTSDSYGGGSNASTMSETTTTAEVRYGSLRRGGSRLKVEMSSDSIMQEHIITDSPGVMDSAKPFTPSRMMPVTDQSDLGDMSSVPSSQAQDLESESTPMPMPQRRQRFTTETIFRQTTTTSTAAPKKDAKPKPYNLETPPMAPQYRVMGKGELHGRTTTVTSANGAQVSVAYADFVPWTGHQPEDQYTETVIRQGLFEKAPPNDKSETSSAKAVVFPALKMKSGGVNALSQILAGVLGHRKLGNQIKSASTFKPPPRVTLTDTKREVWLKDLANPAISLRRLSRTIPHGIRGKILLDHCLNKNVPTDRAVWLAKCVGANEIRAFKRKGVNGVAIMGGEAKWMRDWTLSVEQFVESVLFNVTDGGWKNKLNYAIRLAAHIYSEQLLDREQYLEWLVSGLENSTHPKLPIWTLLLQLYWTDLLSVRKMATRLVAALLAHLQTIQANQDKDLLQPLAARLSTLLTTLIRSSEASFVQPLAWSRFESTIKSLPSSNDEALRRNISALEHRNLQLSASGTNGQAHQRQTLISLLDTTLHSVIPDTLPRRCWELSTDKIMLSRTLLEWCTSIHRRGHTKVYVAARILRVWSVQRFDASGAILEFIGGTNAATSQSRAAFYALVSELVRSGHFSVPRYYQWLIARGGVHQSSELDIDGPCATRLLVELPLDALSESQRFVRLGMLRRVAYPSEEHERDAEAAVDLLKATLDSIAVLPVPQHNAKAIRRFSKLISRSSHVLKAHVGHWLRHHLGLPEPSAAGAEVPDVAFSPSVFSAIRSVLESCEDYRMLAEIISVVSQVSNIEVLASCADTLSRHLLIFSALGVAEELFQGLLSRLKAISEIQGLLARPLLASLAEVASRIPGLDSLAAQLTKDLAQSDRTLGIDACSPVSDNMAVRGNDESGDLFEAIDKSLASGTSMDKPTMDRLFATITSRLQLTWDKMPDQRPAYSSLLRRLRLFDAKQFDQLMFSWIQSQRSDSGNAAAFAILPSLVSAGCLEMSTVLNASISDTSSSAGISPLTGSALLQALQSSYQSMFMQQVLTLLVKPPTVDETLDAQECYRFVTLQDQVADQLGGQLMALIRFAFAEYAFCHSHGLVEYLPLDDPKMQAALEARLAPLVLKDAHGVSKALAAKIISDAGTTHLLERLATKLLFPTNEPATQVSFGQILQAADDLTLPFCHLKLFLSLHGGEPAVGTAVNSPALERSPSALEQLVRAMDEAIDAHNTAWTGLLPLLGAEIAHHLRLRTQSRFLALMPAGRYNPADQQDKARLVQQVHAAKDLLIVIEMLTKGVAASRPPQLAPIIVDKLADLWEFLASPASHAPGLEDGGASMRNVIIKDWLPLLLDFILLHLPVQQQHMLADATRQSSELRARVVLVLLGLMQEVDSSSTIPSFTTTNTPPHVTEQLTQQTAERIFDILCILVDSLSEDARLQCVRAVKDHSADPRLRYLLSYSGGGREERLMLAKKERPMLGRAASSAAAANAAAAAVNNAANGAAPGTAGGGAGEPTSTPDGTTATQRPTAGPAPAPTMGAAMAGRMQPPQPQPEKLTPFVFRRWEVLNEPTPNVGENDTSLNLVLFEARRIR